MSRSLDQQAEELATKLRKVPILADLPEAELHRLLSVATPWPVSAGTVFLEEGTPGDRFYFILDGEVEVTRMEGNHRTVLGVQGSGGFLSEMSLLEDRPRSASARALTDTELLAVDPADFLDLLTRCPGVTLSMLRTVMARLRSTESAVIEKGRMTGLGTMAAGLAHELNNPATAVARSASLLEETLAAWRRRLDRLHDLALTEGERAAMTEVDPLLSTGEPWAGPGSAFRRNEVEMEAWLRDRGLEDGWDLAPTLAEAGWDRLRLEALAGRFAPPHLDSVLHWVSAGAEARTLLDALKRGSRAIADIVARVRSYASLGRGPVQDVDVRDSLVNALGMLRGRIGPRVGVLLDVPVDLPCVEGHGGELGQVWTNLILNAVSAMAGEGALEIRARGSGDGVLVQIIDDGPGIPPEVRPRIFDPFYTTKPEGEGMGLGLAIVHGIVVNGHRGSIRVDSRPGRTAFEVALPASAPPPREQPGA